MNQQHIAHSMYEQEDLHGKVHQWGQGNQGQSLQAPEKTLQHAAVSTNKSSMNPHFLRFVVSTARKSP